MGGFPHFPIPILDLHMFDAPFKFLFVPHSVRSNSSFSYFPIPVFRFHEEDSRHQAQSREQTEIVNQLRQELIDMTVAFKTQILGLREEHHKVTSSLREELKVCRSTKGGL